MLFIKNIAYFEPTDLIRNEVADVRDTKKLKCDFVEL